MGSRTLGGQPLPGWRVDVDAVEEPRRSPRYTCSVLCKSRYLHQNMHRHEPGTRDGTAAGQPRAVRLKFDRMKRRDGMSCISQRVCGHSDTRCRSQNMTDGKGSPRTKNNQKALHNRNSMDTSPHPHEGLDARGRRTRIQEDDGGPLAVLTGEL